MGVKVLSNDGSGSTSGVLEGIEWVIDTAMNDKNSRKVSNLSLGGFFSKAINNAVAMLVDDAGVFTAVAAGNANINACFVSPASASWSSGVVTVGATDVNDVRSVFSNFGKCVDIFGKLFVFLRRAVESMDVLFAQRECFSCLCPIQ